MPQGLVRHFLALIAILVSAGAGFSLVGYLGDQLRIEMIDFEQQAAAGLLASTVVPSFIYNRSHTLRERILTGVQLAIMGVTAAFGFSAKLFIAKGLWLFLAWCGCAFLAVSVFVYMVDRLWRKNGALPTKGELENLTAHFVYLQTIEALFEERLLQKRVLNDSVERLQYFENAHQSICAERKRLEAHLQTFGISPPPFLGQERESLAS